MALKNFRERVKRLPIIGPLLYRGYLKWFLGDGEVIAILGGPLAGKHWVRFIRTHDVAYVRGDYEPAVQTALAENLHSGDVFYDIGGNAGYFSLLGASLVGTNGRVVSYEPHPETARQLKQQMDINGMQQVDLVVAAVSDKSGVADLSDDTLSTMAALIAPSHQSRFKIRVKTTTLDDEVLRHPSPDLIKIDVEGAELRVLDGAKRLLREKRPILLVELHSSAIAKEYDRRMTELGYETWSLGGEKILAAESGDRFVLSRKK